MEFQSFIFLFVIFFKLIWRFWTSITMVAEKDQKHAKNF